MNQNIELEKKLLDRSHSKQETIELLELRYVDGAQSIALTRTGGVSNTNGKEQPAKQLFKRIRSVPKSTRIIVRQYIRDTSKRQRLVIKRLQNYNRRSRRPKAAFPLCAMLKRYNIPEFTDFIQMHNMWQSYIGELLFTDGIMQQLAGTMVSRLAMAEFTGCLITIVSSHDVNLVGMRGIVVWDTQLSFVVCIPRGQDCREWTCPNNKQQGVDYSVSAAAEIGGLRSVPKHKTIFTFQVNVPQPKLANEEISTDTQTFSKSTSPHFTDDGLDSNPETITFSIIGSRFEIRLVDRLNRKFKNHNIDNVF